MTPPPPPYDSRIEYLEGDGASYINTGIVIGSDTNYILSCDFIVNSETPIPAWCRYFGSYTGESYRCTRLINYNNEDNKIYVSYSRRATSGTTIETNYHTRKTYILSRCQLTIDGIAYYITDVDNSTTDVNPVYLFGQRAGMCVYNFSIKHLGKPVLDLIPVRIGHTGCMYDKISKQLFENTGTGSFALGPDIN